MCYMAFCLFGFQPVMPEMLQAYQEFLNIWCIMKTFNTAQTLLFSFPSPFLKWSDNQSPVLFLCIDEQGLLPANSLLKDLEASSTPPPWKQRELTQSSNGQEFPEKHKPQSLQHLELQNFPSRLLMSRPYTARLTERSKVQSRGMSFSIPTAKQKEQ